MKTNRARARKSAGATDSASPLPVRMLVRKEVAALARVHPHTLDRLIAKGLAPKGIQIGRQYVWRPEVIGRWLSGEKVA